MNTLPNDTKPHEGKWATPVDRLKVSGISKQAINLNVDGRRLEGPLQGFGQLWQKTYRVRLSGATIDPKDVIKTWRENFGSFWPKGNNFYAPLTAIEPGEVAILNLAGPGGLPLSTGVRVIYVDDESFSFMTPQGHMYAAFITFSAYEEDGATVVQVQPLLRASDPFYEIGMRLGYADKKEDAFWNATLVNIAKHFGVHAQPTQQVACIDPRWQWKYVGNVWNNAAIRTALYTPVRIVKRLFANAK
ncbi:MAG: hypothetical protein HZB51_01360 [Chloroflexi bacterium]|nr:hypothetical protein [Chloroflexota bacterium]